MLLFRLLRDAFCMRDAFKRYAFLCDAFPSARCLFACDAYLIIPLSEFLPFTIMALFLPALTRYMSCLTYPFSLSLGYLILSYL